MLIFKNQVTNQCKKYITKRFKKRFNKKKHLTRHQTAGFPIFTKKQKCFPAHIQNIL